MRAGERLPRAERGRYVTRRVDGELLVYDLERHTAHCLDEAAAAVWASCDGRTTVAEAAARVGSEEAVCAAVEALAASGLVESVAAPDRRRALGAAARVAGAAAVPLVLTILAPAAYAQGSGRGGDPCAASSSLPDGCPCSASSACASLCCSPDTGTQICVDNSSMAFTCI